MLTRRYDNGLISVNAGGYPQTQAVVDNEVRNALPAIRAAICRLRELEQQQLRGCKYCEGDIASPCGTCDLSHMCDYGTCPDLEEYHLRCTVLCSGYNYCPMCGRELGGLICEE